MSDLIDRKMAIDALERKKDKNAKGEIGGFYNAIIQQDIETVTKLPSAQPEPERTGRWQITHAYPHNVHCSVCHKKFAQTHWAVWEDGTLPRNFCPNCGARMKEGDDHD